MPVYDSTFILNPQLEEGGLETRIKEATELIASHGGKIVKENRIGMRRMAYEIEKVTQGYYVSLVFEGDRKTIDELERLLRLDEACLRFLTCHYQDFSRKRDRKSPAGEGAAAESQTTGETEEESSEEGPRPIVEKDDISDEEL